MKKEPMKLIDVLKRFNIITPICKTCFKKEKNNNLTYFLCKNHIICANCRKEFEPIFESFDIGKYKGLAVYEYDEKVRNCLYQIKGCFDIELAPIFLEDFIPIFKVKFYGFYKVYVPSYFEDDQIRGFNHVEEIFKFLKLNEIKCLIKTSRFKQADQSFKDRQKIVNYLDIKDGKRVFNKKILLVDDVITTGNSLMSCLSLLEKYKPKKIFILVISKTKDKLHI